VHVAVGCLLDSAWQLLETCAEANSGMRSANPRRFDLYRFLNSAGLGKKIVQYRNKQVVFSQGDPAARIFYIQKGRVKLTVVSKNAKEAVVAILGDGDFLGEGCLAGQPLRISTATAISPSSILEIRKSAMMRVLREEQAFAERFIAHILARNIRFEADLVDQLFNSSEKRLARTLLLLARYGKEGKPETIVPKISQETLAEMVGTTRSRVSFFMNRFRKLGFIEYNGGLSVHSSLLNVFLIE
jgi:CRP/FNR family transcriptional regulator, cyclic AMP receptor protein